MISRADDNHIRHHVIAKERLRQSNRVKEDIIARPRLPIDQLQQTVAFGVFNSRIPHHGAGWHFARADDSDAALRMGADEILAFSRRQHIKDEKGIGRARPRSWARYRPALP